MTGKRNPMRKTVPWGRNCLACTVTAAVLVTFAKEITMRVCYDDVTVRKMIFSKDHPE